MNGAPELPHVAITLLDSYASAHGATPRVWAHGPAGWTMLHPQGGHGGAAPPPKAPRIQGPMGRELCIDVTGGPPDRADASAGFLASALACLLEQDAATAMLADAYEEIDGLYHVSKILSEGNGVDQVARNVLGHLQLLLGVKHGAVWIHDAGQQRLRRAAATGEPASAALISIEDPCSVVARVFREQAPVRLDSGEEGRPAGCDSKPGNAGPALFVPVMYTHPHGTARSLGVLSVAGRWNEAEFSPGDHKLLSVVAIQLSLAIVAAQAGTAEARTMQ